MDSMILLLLFLFAFTTSPTWATNARLTHFKEIVCNQCQQFDDYTDLVTPGSVRVGKAGPRGNQGPPGPQAAVNMTLIEQSIDRKIKKALQLITSSSCDGANFESAFALNDSGGIFKSYIPTIGFKDVFCDVTDEGGNWTVFQRRMNGDVYFYRGWDDYVKGFGDIQGDHWLGLEALHQMTKQGNMELKINMITRDGIYWVAKYRNFRIGPGSDKYRLHASRYSGNTSTDGISYHNNQQFSTKDADHDGHSTANCASDYESAWWYKSCLDSNLNGNFYKTDHKGITFNSIILRFSEMKFRKRL